MKLSRRDFLRTSAMATAAVAAGMAKPVTLFGAPFPGNVTGTAVASKVFIVVIDGLRNDEAFDDPYHTYIPHIWNDLRPAGTINVNFWNTGSPQTSLAHVQIATGVRQLLHIEYSDTGKSVSKYPTIFEYYRKEKNIPKEKVWVISGKGDILNSLNTSLHPDYKGWEASKESFHSSDLNVLETVIRLMDTCRPSLVLINLAQTDFAGHSGFYDEYVKAVSIADNMVYRLWRKIQSDPFYKDVTDMIVVADHGRNADENGLGIKVHGDDDHGNRHIPFLAIGPDFKQNEVVAARGDHVDIAPTVGAILGVQMPYVDGRVMTELFKDPTLGQTVLTGGQRRVRLSAYADGVHAVWSKKDGQEWDIMYQKSTNGGTVRTEPVKLFSNGTDGIFFYEADITSRDDGIVYAVARGYKRINKFGQTFVWRLYGIRSTDGGASFGKPVELTKKPSGVGHAGFPHVVSNGKYIVVVYTAESVEALISSDGGLTFSSCILDVGHTEDASSRALFSDVAISGTNVYAIWGNDRDYGRIPPFWNVFFSRLDLSKPAWEEPRIITPGGVNDNPSTFFLDNSIDVNSRGLLLMASTRRLTGEDEGKILVKEWECFLQESGDGSAFGGYPFLPSGYDVWSPKVAFLRSLTDDYLMVWERHSGGTGGEIRGRVNRGGVWHETFRISPAGLVSAAPALSAYKGDVYAGWAELVNSVWQVKIKKIL